MTDQLVGFIGVGNMGAPMSKRLLAAGARVSVFDLSATTVDALVSSGAVAAESPLKIANDADTIFVSLPNGAAVEQALLGESGVINGKSVKRVVDFSTIGPRAAIAISKALAGKGITYVDAPVSGGVPGATAGTLALMVACANDVLSDLRPLLENFGKVYHVAEAPGQAQVMKLANNLLSAAAIAISSEAMVMGVKAGLDPKVMLDVINAGSGRNSATQDKFPRSILPGTFDYGFSTGLALKDVRLCLDEAHAMEVPTIVGAAVQELLSITQAAHGPQSDYTSMCRSVESWAKVEVRLRT